MGIFFEISFCELQYGFLFFKLMVQMPLCQCRILDKINSWRKISPKKNDIVSWKISWSRSLPLIFLKTALVWPSFLRFLFRFLLLVVNWSNYDFFVRADFFIPVALSRFLFSNVLATISSSKSFFVHVLAFFWSRFL